LLLQDIQECAQKIQRYTNEYTYDSFIDDDKTVDAVIRNFEIIGEASSKIEKDFKLKTPQINWSDLKSLRNRMIHDYTGIDYLIVWEIITNYISELEFQVDILIKEIE